MRESERLARLLFDAVRDDDFPRRFLACMHPDVSLSLSTRAGAWLRGLDAVRSAAVASRRGALYEAVAEHYHALDDEHVIVEGRLRWTDETRTLRDDPALWAMTFRDGLLYRSLPVRSLAEGETALRFPPPDAT
jgi:hypothetical protein